MPQHRSHIRPLLPLRILLCLTSAGLASVAPATPAGDGDGLFGTGSVVFIHPDGASAAHWAALRYLEAGPDGHLHWDRLAEMGVYRGHQKDNVSTSSHAGATAHAFGRKVPTDSYGMHGTEPLEALSGSPDSILVEAQKAGMPVGLIQSGHIAEPGTGVFATSSESRSKAAAIAAGVVGRGVPLCFAGGEVLLLPEGEVGRHGEPGIREDGRNLIEEARDAGYTVVFDRAELLALDPAETEKVLGVFAARHTFNDQPEEALKAAGLPLFEPGAPTVAEMTRFALDFFAAKEAPFFLVVEEEGTDNFSNNANAKGMLEALARADDAIGETLEHMRAAPRTLLLTAADSNAGGPALLQIRDPAMFAAPLPAESKWAAMIDGRDGTGTPPFAAAPDRFGKRLRFGIAWSGKGDYAGGVVAKAHGLNADLLPNNVQNTDIYSLMYATLFGRTPER